jgi:hypothetical protein
MSTVYLLDPSSTLATHIVTKTGSKMSIGNQTLPSPPNTTGANYVLNVQGSTCSNNVSAFQIPADNSANRPTINYAGYLRYNTDANYIEYWNPVTSLWTAISEAAPTISAISPQYIAQSYTTTTYVITGSNFNATSNASFIGNNDSIVYPTASTTFISSSVLNAVISQSIADASTNTAFAVKVANSTGASATSGYIVTYNKGPVWNTAIGSTIGVGSSEAVYTTSNSPFSDLSASDVTVPPDNPIKYYFSSGGAPATGTTIFLDASLGRLYGTMPALLSSTNYSLSTFAQDASNAKTATVSFNITVQPALLTVTGYTLSSNYFISYVDSSNNSLGSPSSTGYTIYRFTGTGITGTVTPNFTYASLNYLVVGGGGGGGSGASGSHFGGGGGAGGYRAGTFSCTANTAYDVIVGVGGTYTNSANAAGTAGGFSRFGPSGASGITSDGGGGGAAGSGAAGSGGSGGGGNYVAYTSGGSGNSGAYTPVEGFNGGSYNTGGQGAPGGSALEKGNETTTTGSTGAVYNITGTNVTYASGGYGNNSSGPAVNNSSGNGGNGGNSGTVGTGGSSGVVILRFPSLLSFTPSPTPNGGTVTGFSPGQYTITYVNSSNTVINSPLSGGYTIYSFLATTTGTFVPNFNASSTVDFLVIGGGGAGGSGGGDQVGAGGGGAGGYRTSYGTSGGSLGTAESKLSFTASTSYTVTVGAGGDGQNASNATGNNGANSVFSTITSVGGGGGGSTGGGGTSGATGGSGGGANPYAGSAGSGNSNQGFAGFKTSSTSFSGGGGGGGASATGGNSSGTGIFGPGGAGGNGITSTITGASVARGGGGGGGAYSTTTTANGGTGGSGGGGAGASSASGTNNPGSPGTQNTGGGGGGCAGGGSAPSTTVKGGSGGSGIVIIRFLSF